MLYFPWKNCSRKSIKNTITEVDEKIKDEKKCPETKSLIEFDQSLTCSITSLAVKKNNEIKTTTRFFSGKMLM